MGRYNDQSRTKIKTQINELSDLFQEYDINAMNTRSTTGPEMDPGTDHLTDHQTKIIHSIHLKTLDQITETTVTRTARQLQQAELQLRQRQEQKLPTTTKIRTEKPKLRKQVSQ